MKKTFQKIIMLSFVALWFAPSLALAHQPRLTESRRTIVPDPEISKAYYGQLQGEPDVYVINASAPFDLYVNLLVPDIAGQKKDVSAAIIKDGDAGHPLAALDGPGFDWKRFYEPFGADTYWMGPEYKARAEAGAYEIRVSSADNDSKYSLAIGEAEAFGGQETLKALAIIPKLKKNFFNESPIGFIRSPFGWGLIAAMYLLAGIAGFVLRLAAGKIRKSEALPAAAPAKERGARRNIGQGDRLIRLAIGAGLLLWAVLTSWNPVLIFLSGFALFEAIFSWCLVYQLMGKNTRPS